jgi:hypothetical protein
MSTVFVLIVVLGLLGAATFLVGFGKGVREAVREHRHPQPEGAWSDDGHYGISALFAVAASALVIALVGVAPAWIYAGPILAIVTAAGVGVAFLLGDKRPAPGSKA